MARRRWQLTKTTVIWKNCRKYSEEILGGKLLAVDPSCGSQSSMPGYAIFEAGELKDSGIIEIPGIHRELPYRLQDLGQCLRNDFEVPDVLAVEQIPPKRYGGGGATGHASLLKSVGTILGNVITPRVIMVRPQWWHALVPDDYEKSDEGDARSIGEAVIHVAKLTKE